MTMSTVEATTNSREHRPTVRAMSASEAEEGIAPVVMAFAQDPIVRWFYPDSLRYWTYGQRLVKSFAGRAFEHGTAKRRERAITPAGDDIVGKRADPLLVRFVAHLRPAHDDGHFRRDAFQHRDSTRRFVHVPDIHAEPDDARPGREHRLDDVVVDRLRPSLVGRVA